MEAQFEGALGRLIPDLSVVSSVGLVCYRASFFVPSVFDRDENMDAKLVPQTTAFELTEACYSLRRVISSRLWWSPSRVLAILLASVAVVSELPGANRSAQGSAQYEALPLMRSRQNHLLVRAVINGRQAWLGVDSGAPVSAIALHRREHFRLTGIPSSSKLPARLQINGGFNNVAIVHNFALGNLNLVDEPVVTVNLRSSTRAARLLEEQEIDGILGADILFPTKAVLDCQRQLLVLKMYPELPGHAPHQGRANCLGKLAHTPHQIIE